MTHDACLCLLTASLLFYLLSAWMLSTCLFRCGSNNFLSELSFHRIQIKTKFSCISVFIALISCVHVSNAVSYRQRLLAECLCMCVTLLSGC